MGTPGGRRPRYPIRTLDLDYPYPPSRRKEDHPRLEKMRGHPHLTRHLSGEDEQRSWGWREKSRPGGGSEHGLVGPTGTGSDGTKENGSRQTKRSPSDDDGGRPTSPEDDVGPT